MRDDGKRVGSGALKEADPGHGIFETVLVLAGEPVALAAHLRRLARSLRELYDAGLPAGIDEMAKEAAGELSLGRLRLTTAPEARGLRLEVVAAEVDPAIVFPSAGIRLARRRLPGGLGSHKLADRPTEIERPAPGRPGALLVDSEAVLEAGWANVFAVRGGTLWTPPLDGRILPGTTRATVLELAAEAGVDAAERPLRRRDLLSADEVFLTSSVRGVEAASELDGEPLGGCGPLSRRLAAALRRRWGLDDGWNDPAVPATVPIADRPAR